MKNTAKRIVAWGLAALIAVGGVIWPAFGAQYDLNKNTYLDVKKTPSGKTGQNMTINMVFTNNGSEDLHQVSIRFDSDAAENEFNAEYEDEESGSKSNHLFPFEITSSTFDAKVIGSVKAGASRNVSLSARVRRDIPEGYYAVPIMVRVNGSDQAVERVNIWVTKSVESTETSKGEEGTIQFEMGENQNTPDGSYPEVMNFTVNVRNTSNITALDVNIRMGLSEDSAKFPFNINDGNYVRHYDRIGGGESVEVPYSMAIRKESYTGYYPISFTIEYRDSSEGDVQKAEEIFYVHVNNKDKEEETKEFNANDRTRARIIVDSFTTNPDPVYAGDEFELVLRMKNASESVSASNILLTLESEKVDSSAVFTTEAGSSSFVINSLGAGQTTEVRLKLLAGAWVEQRTYAITINEKYDSPEFKNAEEKVSVDIPVKQMARLNTGTIEIMPDSISVGAESNVMFSINNTGKVLLYNVMVTFLADSIQKTDFYVGNIEPGKSGNVDAMISGIAPSTDDGKVKILITYEDENGMVSDPIEKEMTLMVTEAADMEMEPLEDMGDTVMNEEPLPGIMKYQKYFIPAGIGAGVVLAAITVTLVKRRRRKKAAAEEEIDDEI